MAFFANDDQRQAGRLGFAGHIVNARHKRAGGVANLAGALLQTGKRIAAHPVRAHHGARAFGNGFGRIGA